MELRELDELDELELELAFDLGTAGLLGRDGGRSTAGKGRPRTVANAGSVVCVLVAVRRSLSRSLSSLDSLPRSTSLSLRGEPILGARGGERGTVAAGSRVTTGARTGANESVLREISLFERRRISDSGLDAEKLRLESRAGLAECPVGSREPESRRSRVRGVAMLLLREGGELDGDLLGGV